MHFEVFEANVVRNYSSALMTFHVGTADLGDHGCPCILGSRVPQHSIFTKYIKTSYSLEIYRRNISARDVDYFCLHIYDADDETLRLHRDRRFVREDLKFTFAAKSHVTTKNLNTERKKPSEGPNTQEIHEIPALHSLVTCNSLVSKLILKKTAKDQGCLGIKGTTSPLYVF